MEIGREIIYSEGDSHLVVNKMSKVFKTEVLWTRNRDGNVSIVGIETEMLVYNQGTYFHASRIYRKLGKTFASR